MIQQLQPGPTLQQAAGKGFVETYQPLIQRELNRQQTSRAINQLKSQSAGASPTDLLYNLIEASTLSPEIGRSLGPLYETLLTQTAAERAPKAIETALGATGQLSAIGREPTSQIQEAIQQKGFKPITQLPAAETAQHLAQQKSGEEIQNLSNQFLRQTRPDLFAPGNFGNIPTFDIASKSALRPQEEANIRKDLTSQGIPPAQQNDIVQKINADIGNRYKEALQNYEIAQGQQRAIDQKWNTIKNDAPTQLKPFLGNFGPKTQQMLTDKYFQYAGSQPINQTPEAVEAQAMTLLQRDLNQLNALAALPSMPPVRQWSDAKNYLDKNKKAYASLKAQGMDQALLEDAINNKDMGIEEAHYTIWGDQTSKDSLNRLANVKKGPNDQKYIDDLSNQLKSLKENDDLILARAMVLNNGGSIDDFLTALEEAQNKGLTLSPFQQSQLQEVQLPRVAPLWEIFSSTAGQRGLGIGGIPGAIFGHFVNYLRGKR